MRYGVMREYLPTRGAMALDMMRRTCTVQANLDYSSEQDMARKMRLALRATPIVTAMFANSPFVEGKVSGDRSRRARVWLHMDPDRSGLLEWAWEGELTYQRYVEYALDVPMFMVKRDGEILRNTGQTFRSFMTDGFQGTRATRGDWETHLNTLFPEARLKKTIELRSADSQDTAMVCALPALWKGLLYDRESMRAAEALLEPLSYADVEAAGREVPEHALHADLGGREIAQWANELVDIASAGLERISALNAKGQDERIHLTKLEHLVREGHCPADVLLTEVSPNDDFLEQVLDWAQV